MNGHGEPGKKGGRNLLGACVAQRQLSRRAAGVRGYIIRQMRPLTRVPFVLALLCACRGGAGDALLTPPAAEFVLAAGDSTFWVTSQAGRISVRAAPIDLAEFDGRFFELYVVDNDLSYTRAELVGQTVYRRDLQTGDSAIVYTDSIVPELARQYARAHPDDERLGKEDEPDDVPTLAATATLDLGAARGPFASYALHTDVERHGAPLWHTSRRGVIDLRTGRAATVADLAGSEAPAIERRRDVSIASARDSVRRGHYHMDPGSFSLATFGGGPAIAYALPGPGTDDASQVMSLDPIGFARPAWWTDVAPSLPMRSADGSREVWRHASYSVVVRYDGSGDARLSLRDSTSREWAVGPVSSPATHIFWLDAPRFGLRTRRALARAFDEAASYGVDTKVASAMGSGAHLAAWARDPMLGRRD